VPTEVSSSLDPVEESDERPRKSEERSRDRQTDQVHHVFNLRAFRPTLFGLPVTSSLH
jgi:hypothetical protein